MRPLFLLGDIFPLCQLFLPCILFQMAVALCFSLFPSLSELLSGFKNVISTSFQMNAISQSLVQIPFPTSCWRISFGCRESQTLISNPTWKRGQPQDVMKISQSWGSTLRNRYCVVFYLYWGHLTGCCDGAHVFYPLVAIEHLNCSMCDWETESLICYFVLNFKTEPYKTFFIKHNSVVLVGLHLNLTAGNLVSGSR